MHCTKNKRQRIALLVAATALLAGPAAPETCRPHLSAEGAAWRWTKIDDFMQEVGDARIYEGVHDRHSTQVGTAIGKLVSQLATVKADDDFFAAR